MKIKLKNLGALQEAEFELADLTIICGENNTGKTYATYALYGFLGQWRSLLDRVYYSTVSFMQNNKSARDAVEILLKDGVVILDIMDHIKYARTALNAMCEIYTLELPSVFSSHPKIFDGASFSIKIDNNEYLENNLLRLDFKKNGPYLDFEKNEGDKNIKISRSMPIEELDSLDPAAQKAAANILLSMSMQEIDLLDRKGLHDSIARTSLQIIFSLLFPNVFISSTERTGAAIFEKELNFARNRLLEKMSSADEKEDLRKLLSKSYQSYALPVMENVEFVRKLGDISKGSSFIAEKHSEVLGDLSDIIGGDYSVHKQIGLQYKPKGEDFKLSMGESSSSVRSLLDIGFYLRHQARVGDLLMIDEPELNLHPRNQRRIARLFARLVNVGLKVFVTTHSDYIVKEFNTLIMLNRDMPHLKRIAEEESYRSDELLDINKVKLYISKRVSIKRENKKRKSMCQTLVAANISQEGGIEVDSFDQTINKMNEIQDSIMWGYD